MTGTALDGIYVEDISVGGMTEEQITQAVNDKIEQLKPSSTCLPESRMHR